VTRFARRHGIWLLTLVPIAIVLGILAIRSYGSSILIDGYRDPINFPQDLGPNEIGLVVTLGPGDGVRVANVTESEREVHVDVRAVRPIFQSGPAIGIYTDYRVELQAPLGDRVVIDGLGREVPRLPASG
jgi:hypothetical protein